MLRLVRALEQYYLLESNCNLNVLKVAGANRVESMSDETKGKIRARAIANTDPLYIYSADGKTLYYIADSIRGLHTDIDNLINRVRLTNSVKNGTLLCNRFNLTRKPNSDAVVELITL